jgi:trk system potassium uptake protein TrkH
MFSTSRRVVLDRHLRPAQLLVLAFAVVILCGTVLLTLPWASRAAPLTLVDALFTSTSATCVTGLVVVDTGTRLSGFGQGVVLALIQLGGLGIMTYSSLVLLALGGRLSFRGEALVQDTLGARNDISPGNIVRNVFLFTLVAETLGALALSARFVGAAGFWQGLYSGVFHSVSAFCNAGFALRADSFVTERGDWWVNGTLMVLITLGGLGFVVLNDVVEALGRLRRRHRARLRLHSKVVLVWSALLTGGGAAAILLLESNTALAGLPWDERLLASLFQSVTARTAGFNTLDYGALADVSLLVTIVLMFIGASPGSCGGGIKTTSAAVVAALFWNRMCGRTRVTLFRRTVPDAEVTRAITILVAATAVVTIASFLLTLTEVPPHPHRGETAVFLDMAFETVSAFGTVGLSTGITAGLSALGKLLVTALMFAGRLGPLTLAMAVGTTRSAADFSYAEENLMVG